MSDSGSDASSADESGNSVSGSADALLDSDGEEFYVLEDHPTILNPITEIDLERFHSKIERIDLDPAGFGPRISWVFQALKEMISKVQRDSGEEGISLRGLHIDQWGDKYVMVLADWMALADLLASFPSIVRLQLLWNDESVTASTIPPAFYLHLQQHCFDLQLDYYWDDYEDALLSTLYQHCHQETHFPPVDSSAIRFINHSCFSTTSLAILVSLGRWVPEHVAPEYHHIMRRKEGESIEMISAMLRKNLWLRWGEWDEQLDVVKPGSARYAMYGPVPKFTSDEEFNQLAYNSNRRNLALRDSTRNGATSLLRAARPILLALPISRPRVPSISDANPIQQSHSPHSSQSGSSLDPSLLPPSRSPILAMPYEILHIILSHLSAGDLSVSQVGFVLRWPPKVRNATKAPAKKSTSKTTEGEGEDGEKKNTKRKGKKHVESYSSYIYKVLKQVHPDTGISKDAMSTMNSLNNDIFERLATEAATLAKINHKATIGAREIKSAVSLVLPGELSKHAISEGAKSLAKYQSVCAKEAKKGSR